ncbi:hypothetical protein NIES2100_05300 [Calothrix sp. NIES-2100]|uniref:hypothetical protein n=1 Tax=Calothrix sp. NIES-2100 TaxID=1954172 RepID=UPI000B5DF5E1|nr:hypothetical protein NIES2100_05300 [Calothrix sp. NIES-2100]
MTEYNNTVIHVGDLFTVRIYKETVIFRWQNFVSNQIITWSNKQYTYLPINFKSPAKSLEVSSESTIISVPNLPEIRQYVENYKGFRNSIIECVSVYPDNPNATPRSKDLMVVKSSRYVNASIEFELSSRLSSIQGNIPSTFFTTGKNVNGLNIVGYIPEIPVTSNINLS